ncbi:ATP-binding protein [Mycobacterium sp.]|uniref:ATP-binding protein n=1 Tax=Mycobacterium sp. TaxID=1785 RepID=UPI002B8133D4|nr:adenylate/guanylate cyclase domain-containing protein [Mycobacterium sp.]HTQ16922.1 adenylate/guanylate cyclase domain-containing protein [Mycobacterium sp.]
MTAGLPCLTCGTESLENARFCHGCGAPVADAEKPAEYKQVTVLFADVVRSMDIATAVGAERLREIMTEMVDRCSSVVQRYGGTVDKFTGDGIMALFGAPTALEDHALRACLAALGIQEQAKLLAVSVNDRDGIELRMRIGLNSGQVIAGEIGSGALGYTAVGDQVGMAQRMESVAPPGGVMLSDSTARLVEGATVLGESQMVRLKGSAYGVSARPLLSVTAPDQKTISWYSTLVGREWELATLTAMLDRSIKGRGSVVALVGLPGLGKTRLVDETVRVAKQLGVEVFSAYCESHATDIAFDVVARLGRSRAQISGMDDASARARIREAVPDADPQDLLLLDDLLGIADPESGLPKIDPEARRRRLTALINAAQLARPEPAVIVIEDVHWIDEISDSMLADFLAVIPQTHTMVLLTYRPEYDGPLQHVAGAQTIALAPLSDTESSVLLDEVLGSDPSVAQIGEIIAGRAAGNPFFAQEIIRELAERGVLQGERGDYTCDTDVAEVSVPPSLQATIAARIDRLSPQAKQTLAAAAIIGFRFGSDLLIGLDIDPRIDELIVAELIDQVRFTARAEYEFRHPLIRTVAYEAQLKSDRARLHRQLAASIESRDPHSPDQHAVLIAEHLELAGDWHAAYGWHMRAAGWATNRDVGAAQLSWEHAAKIADALPADDPGRAVMRITPRTMLCGIAWRVRLDTAVHFEELRQLCAASGDKTPLAVAMAGLVLGHAYQTRLHQASALASEAMEIIEALGDPTLMVGLAIAPIYAKGECTEWFDALRWLERVIELADGDPTKGNFLIGSPLALALTMRAQARCFLGQPGWEDDMRQGLAMARNADPFTYTAAAGYIYGAGIPSGVVNVDDATVREVEDVVHKAELWSDDLALNLANMMLGLALVHRQSDSERGRGQKVLSRVRDVLESTGHNSVVLPVVHVYVGREMARRGDRDDAILSIRAASDQLVREGRLLGWGTPVTAVLVETLLDRGTRGDLVEAETAVERLARVPVDGPRPVRDILVLRMRAGLARARGDDAAYVDFRDRYRDMASSMGYQGHTAWAAAMP